jgi:hypothetical protein
MADRPAILKHTGNEELDAPLFVYGATAYLAMFFSANALEVTALTTPTPRTASVDSYSRRRYPGGKSTTVDSHSRLTRVGDTESGGGAKPGQRFWCEYDYIANGVAKKKTYQFSYLGTWRDLRALASQFPARSYTLRNYSGEQVNIVD